MTEFTTTPQVSLIVVDGGDPPLNDTCTLQVQVILNIFAPVCNAQPGVTINYTQPLGVPIFRMNATDADRLVCFLMPVGTL